MVSLYAHVPTYCTESTRKHGDRLVMIVGCVDAISRATIDLILLVSLLDRSVHVEKQIVDLSPIKSHCMVVLSLDALVTTLIVSL
jgi:hypothetical protein